MDTSHRPTVRRADLRLTCTVTMTTERLVPTESGYGSHGGSFWNGGPIKQQRDTLCTEQVCFRGPQSKARFRGDWAAAWPPEL